MANQLKVAVVHAIEVLLERGWFQRRIAGVLGINRGTVAGYGRLSTLASGWVCRRLYVAGFGRLLTPRPI